MFRRVVIGMAMFAILSFFSVAYLAWVDALAFYKSTSWLATKDVPPAVVATKKKGKRHGAVR